MPGPEAHSAVPAPHRTPAVHLNAQLPHAGLPVGPGYTWLDITNTTPAHPHPPPPYTHSRGTRDLRPGVIIPTPSAVQTPGTWNKPISHPGKLAPTPEALPTLPRLGFPLLTCSWTILLWADAQGPRPCSRSCSRRPSPKRQRCRLSCSASNPQPEMGRWGTQGAESEPVSQPRPGPHPLHPGSCPLGASLQQSPSLGLHQGCSHLEKLPSGARPENL